jgi:hypothetical protein
MATRMQQRRGTATQWTTANPILNAAEIGWESDNNRFKIGDGVNHWGDLPYFVDGATIQTAINDLIGTAPGTLNTLAEIAEAIGNDPDFLDNLITSEDITALEDQLDDKVDKTQYDAKGDLIVGNADNTPAKLSVGENGYLLTANSAATNGVEWAAAPVSLPSQTGNDGKYLSTDGTDATWETIDLSAKQDVVANVSDTEIGYLDGVTSAIQEQLNTKALDSDLTTLEGVVDGKLDLAGGTMTGAITLSGAPSSDLHAATKAYVDSIAEGLHVHPSVVAATTANIDLSTAVENGDVLDGVTLATGDRILVKNQSTASQNGIYVVAASGAPTRALDFDSPAEIDGGDFVFVTGGTVNDNTGYVQTNTVGTIGTDPIVFSQFSGAGTFAAGTGLTLTGNTFSINTATTVDLSTAQSLSNKTIVAPRVQVAMNAQTGTGYTLVLTDASNRWVTMDNSSAITVTVPPSVFATGDQINVQTIGTGQVTFAQGAGVTITSAGGTSTAPKIRSRYSSATVICVGSNSFTIVGDLI